jgi:hypothetical protein
MRVIPDVCPWKPQLIRLSVSYLPLPTTAAIDRPGPAPTALSPPENVPALQQLLLGDSPMDSDQCSEGPRDPDPSCEEGRLRGPDRWQGELTEPRFGNA